MQEIDASSIEEKREARAVFELAYQNLIRENRFFTDNYFLDSLEYIFRKKTIIKKRDQLLYRARRFESENIDNKKLGEKFEGYDEEGSFVNKGNNWGSVGRMNPKGINVLYTSGDKRTCILELHPYYGEIYSVATIQVLNDLKIADLSREYSVHKDSFEEELSVLVQRNLSKGNGEEDYVFPQFVAAYCKKLGYDGIGYRSKYASKYDTQNGFGINYSIFNYDKCKAISSILMKVREMNVDISEYNMFKR